ncbi:SixA phosphatase family protein [Chitinolyticbacter meiyuanensis]|uniref:SixA phosphatase family protein n=1 Tax=Chitinolyticbacter meiyuanensis TaxID=682798 RepID=UPI0011E5DD08|nr:histidine phosphatase family protein [Chitinolyticbacter meiyuanensis]
MDLILWRHAEAEDGNDDLARALTSTGRKQARKMAAWLAHQLAGQPVRVVASAARRAQETAQALTPHPEIDARLNPGARAAAYLEVCDWPRGDGRVVVLVGHQPTLGRAASLLLTGGELDWSLKKASIWWLQRRVKDGAVQYLLKAVHAPDL